MAKEIKAGKLSYASICAKYQIVMTEVARRQDVIETAIHKGPWTQDPRATEEFCCFQLRMICELIAIGCLVAHGDVVEPEKNRFKPMYQADKIIKALERLNEHFFPRPAEFDFPEGIDGKMVATTINEGYLTKEEFLSLYRKCSDILHVGSFELWEKKLARVADSQILVEWHRRLVTLLSNHQITLPEKGFELWTNMRNMHGITHCGIVVKQS